MRLMMPGSSGDNISASSNGMKDSGFMFQRNFHASSTISVTAIKHVKLHLATLQLAEPGKAPIHLQETRPIQIAVTEVGGLGC